jgi:sec-independent protein translocase protein TatA
MIINNILLGIFGLGATEITLVVVVLLIFFGGKRIPELAKGIGKGIREFKDASKEPANNDAADGGHKEIKS